MNFDQKVVIVTGASSGIGLAAAAAFARDGARVVLVGRNQAALDDAVGTVTAGVAAGSTMAVSCAADITAADAPDRIVQSALQHFGGIDVLVNAAGVIATGTIETTSDEVWDAMMGVNLRAPFRLMRAATSHLKARKGAVVNVSSVNGLRSFAGVLAYNVSKAGMDHLTRCAALEMAPHGVRVNAVNPGVTVTNLHRRSGMDETQYAAFLQRSKETHPMGRPGNPEEVASLIVYLASDRAAWMTGETIPIDGGRHLTCLR
jgi:NAD(P)-dependent dehydrogenase (short-subunit alcohol dehydrogenase family)